MTFFYPKSISLSVNTLFGNKTNGNMTLSSDTTLTGDVFYDTFDLATYKLTTAGYRIFCHTLIGSSGAVIRNNGSNGNNNGSSAAVPGAPQGTLGGGGAAGLAIPGTLPPSDTVYCLGGSAGNGGSAYGGQAGSAGGSASYSAAKGPPFNALQATTGRFQDGNLVTGGRGGGYGKRNTANESSDGGSGAGVIVVATKVMTGTFHIEAKGGNSANVIAGTNGGSGSPGAGGVIFIIHSGNIPGTITTSVIAGTAGTPLGDGTAGSASSPGRVLTFPV